MPGLMNVLLSSMLVLSFIALAVSAERTCIKARLVEEGITANGAEDSCKEDCHKLPTLDEVIATPLQAGESICVRVLSHHDESEFVDPTLLPGMTD